MIRSTGECGTLYWTSAVPAPAAHRRTRPADSSSTSKWAAGAVSLQVPEATNTVASASP
ncbi:Uncharacterised protein [Mycobacteroides abscessus subsp. abscessus]|nr:Uncharacterised protein [Mycobacteroides abscessus subsp. abscessus]